MKKFVTLSVAGLLVLPALGCAQEHKDSGRTPAVQRGAADKRVQRAEDNRNGDTEAAKGPRRLESVTWNSVNHELTWIISRGEKKPGAGYQATEKDTYNINMDKATMAYHGEIRRFSKEEASNVHMLMDLIAKYAVDSTIWWDQGQGHRVGADGKDIDTDEDDDVPAGKPAGKEKSSVIHVSALGRRLSDRELDAKIKDLEERLVSLKRLQQMVESGPVKPASY